MDLRFHNTLTGKKETLVPIEKNVVGLYVCGITPYDEPHLGHARCYVIFDLLKRFLVSQGFRVTHIQNYTDIDDKIIERANKVGQAPRDLAQKNIGIFEEMMKRLNVLPADRYPRVTEHIPEIIRLIEQIISHGLGYVVQGNVFFSVRKFPSYGRLSKRKIDELNVGARVDVDESKQDPLDFALWKKAKPGEPFWDSPWGPGRPGWHIECSAMSMKYLGEEFDIHGGGQDLIFPHHENETAQSMGGTGRNFAHLWIHNGFVTLNREKMSKSLNNFFTLTDIFKKHEPMAVRYFLLTQHYRSPLDFSDQELQAAQTTWVDRIMGASRLAPPATGENVFPAQVPLPSEFIEALGDDLNTPVALAVLNQICSEIFVLATEAKTQGGQTIGLIEKGRQLRAMLTVLGLSVPEEEKWDEALLQLLQEREEARAKKDWARSDLIRAELKKRGVRIEDTATGPRLKRI